MWVLDLPQRLRPYTRGRTHSTSGLQPARPPTPRRLRTLRTLRRKRARAVAATDRQGPRGVRRPRSAIICRRPRRCPVALVPPAAGTPDARGIAGRGAGAGVESAVGGKRATAALTLALAALPHALVRKAGAQARQAAAVQPQRRLKTRWRLARHRRRTHTPLVRRPRNDSRRCRAPAKQAPRASVAGGAMQARRPAWTRPGARSRRTARHCERGAGQSRCARRSPGRLLRLPRLARGQSLAWVLRAKSRARSASASTL